MLTSLLRRFARAQSGASAMIYVLMIPVFVGMAAVVIDLNHVRVVRKNMQTSADAAALAASMDIGSATVDPLATAASYSATAGNKNAIPGVTVTMVATYPQLGYLTPTSSYGLGVFSSASTGTGCNSPTGTGCNVIYVKETARVPTIFSGYFGLSSIPITVSAAAAGHGGNSKLLDVMIILDTTQSMTQSDSYCSSSKIACAEAGVQTLLKTLAPSVDQVGLMVFPGVTNTANAAYDYDCSGSKPAVAAYNNSPVYTIVGLANDYRSSDSATSLNTSSNIVRAVGGGGTGCSNGLTVVGGQGTFYAAAITAAQSYLAANGRTGAQKVIIILSDGDAQSSTAPNTLNECGQAVTTASAAKTAGTWIYTIGYAAQTTTAPSGSCANDTSPKTSACATLQSMATDSAHFFYDTPSTCTGGRSVSNVQSAFQQVANSLMAPTLIPYSG